MISAANLGSSNPVSYFFWGGGAGSGFEPGTALQQSGMLTSRPCLTPSSIGLMEVKCALLLAQHPHFLQPPVLVLHYNFRQHCVEHTYVVSDSKKNIA
jgi:hypothetical protein